MDSKWLMAAFWSALGLGAFAIPALYVAFTRFRGRCTKPLLFGVFAQLCLIALVCVISHLDFRRGNLEAYYWGLLLIPLNFVAFLYYVGVIAFWYDRPDKSVDGEHSDAAASRRPTERS